MLLRHSSFVLAPEQIEFLESQQLPEDELPSREVESTVSRALVTATSERQIVGLLGLAMVALVLVDRRYGRRSRVGPGGTADQAASSS